MYFRFGIALTLVLLIWGGRILLDRQNSKLHTDINAQHQQMEVMRDYHAHLRIRTARISLQSKSEKRTTLPVVNSVKENSEKQNHVSGAENGVVPLLQIGD